MKLKGLGFWNSASHPDLPNPIEVVDAEWDEAELDYVRFYLKRGQSAKASMGRARCQLCDIELGSLTLTDGVYAWPQGLDHYIEAHRISLPREFIEHVVSASTAFEESEVELTWWTGAMQGEAPAGGHD